jgi:hypothetical protein
VCERQDVNSIKLWRQMAGRLSGEAARRGGRADVDDDTAYLYPPSASGEPVRVLRGIDPTGTDQTIFIAAGFAFQVAESLNNTDDIDYVLTTAVAVLDGHAAEVAEVAEDGTWLNHGSVLATPAGGGMRRLAPAWHLKDVPVHHEHRRQIEPWPRPAGSGPGRSGS